MATDARTEMSEPELLHLFLQRRLAKGERNGSLDEVMAEFAKWRSQVEKVRQMVRQAEESSALYGSKPLRDKDLEEMINEVYEDLAKEGIVD
jgi:hypothetical protein